MVLSGLESEECSAGPGPALAGCPGELYYNVRSNSMGKRELLLVLGFLVVGAIVYQASAPPPAPGERSFSLGQAIDHIKRAVRSNRASAEATTTTRHPVAAGVTALRLKSRLGALTIIGEDRNDIEAELRVRSNGADADEARRLAEATKLAVRDAGPSMAVEIDYPAEGTQRTLKLTLKVPSRLRIDLDESGTPLSVTGVAGVELSASRGEATLREIKGAVTGTHRGGDLFVADAQSVKLEVSGSEAQIQRVAGDLSVKVRGGDLRGRELGGSVQIDAQGSDVTLEGLQKARGLLRVTASAGSITVRDLATEARMDVRNTEVDVEAVTPATLTIRSEGGGSIDVRPAPGGYQLDALTAGGNITLPDQTLVPVTTGQEHRASGAVEGGGPTLLLRTTQADIVVRER